MLCCILLHLSLSPNTSLSIFTLYIMHPLNSQPTSVSLSPSLSLPLSLSLSPSLSLCLSVCRFLFSSLLYLLILLAITTTLWRRISSLCAPMFACCHTDFCTFIILPAILIYAYLDHISRPQPLAIWHTLSLSKLFYSIIFYSILFYSILFYSNTAQHNTPHHNLKCTSNICVYYSDKLTFKLKAFFDLSL